MTDYTKPLAGQDDIFGQKENDLFLARFADDILGTFYVAEINHAYGADKSEDFPDPNVITDEIEQRLDDAGFETVWENGVFIYKQS